MACTPISVPLTPDTGKASEEWIPPTVEVLPESPEKDRWIFNTQTVHQIEVQVDAEGIESLYASPFQYVQGTATFDGIDLGVIGLRLKGKIGSYVDLDGKSAFKIDLNRYEEGKRFEGLEQFTLNNSVVDCSYMKENLGYHVYRAAGIPASRTGYAWVTLNGESYGLYVLVETPDDRFLKRHFAEPDGNLYDGKYVWFGGWDYFKLDFQPDLAPYFELEEGTDISRGDINTLADVVDQAVGTAEYYDLTAPLLNWDRQHRQVAVAQWIGHIDGYSMNQNNYRVYFDPEDDRRAMIIPWDLDYAFLRDYQWNKSWETPPGRLTYWCMADERCREAQREAAVWVLESVIDEDELLDLIDDTRDVIEPYMEDDPRRECRQQDFSSSVSYLRSWVRNRDEHLEEFWEIDE